MRLYRDLEAGQLGTLRIAVDCKRYDWIGEGEYSPAEPARVEIQKIHLVDGLALVAMPDCIFKQIVTNELEAEILAENIREFQS